MGPLFALVLSLLAIFLILLVLVQRGRGGGLAGALGGMGGSSAFGAKAGDVFTRITIITASIWIAICLIALLWAKNKGDAFGTKAIVNPPATSTESGTMPPLTAPANTSGAAAPADTKTATPGETAPPATSPATPPAETPATPPAAPPATPPPAPGTETPAAPAAEPTNNEAPPGK
jgi:preprotein translocase subunit SecG